MHYLLCVTQILTILGKKRNHKKISGTHTPCRMLIHSSALSTTKPISELFHLVKISGSRNPTRESHQTHKASIQIARLNSGLAFCRIDTSVKEERSQLKLLGLPFGFDANQPRFQLSPRIQSPQPY